MQLLSKTHDLELLQLRVELHLARGTSDCTSGDAHAEVSARAMWDKYLRGCCDVVYTPRIQRHTGTAETHTMRQSFQEKQNDFFFIRAAPQSSKVQHSPRPHFSLSWKMVQAHACEKCGA